MSYPDHISLTQPIRRTILVGLILLFVLISPIVIFYTAGYRYDITTHTIQQTGVLSINARPRDARVTANNVSIDKRLPIRLSNRAPGTYWVRIEKDGYYPWEKSIVIRSNETTYIRDVTLIKKDEPEQLAIDTTNLIDLDSSPNGKFLSLLEVDSGVYTVLLYDTRKHTSFPLFSEQLDAAPTIQWSPYNPYVLIHTVIPSGSKVEIINAENPNTRTITTLLPTSTLPTVQWEKNQNTPVLYLQKDNTIVRLSGNDETLVAHTTSSIWHIDQHNELWWYNTDEKRLVLPKSKDNNERTIALEKPITQMLDINAMRLIAYGDNETLHVAFHGDRTHTITRFPGVHSYFDTTVGEWYIWSQTELWNLYPDGSYQILNRSSEPFERVRTLDETGHLLITTSNRLTTFHPGYSSTQEIFAGAKELSNVSVDRERKTVFFFGTIQGTSGIFEMTY